MKRTTVFLDPMLERDLRLHAERQRRSTASVVREALAQWVEQQRATAPPRPAFVASGRSGHADTAERHEDLVFGDLVPHGGDAAADTATLARRRRTPGRRRSARSRVKGTR